MTTVTRDEFEEVKTLLLSAARYAESAQRRADALEANRELDRQDRLLQETRFDRRIEQMLSQLERSQIQQERTQMQIEALVANQASTQQKLDALTVRVQQISDRVDGFITESQRLLSGQADRINRLEGISERLEGILSYLVRKSDQ